MVLAEDLSFGKESAKGEKKDAICLVGSEEKVMTLGESNGVGNEGDT